MNEITDSTFEEAEKASHAVVYFSASWCGPCKMFAPRLEEVLGNFEGRLVAGKVDVDENPELVERFKIMGMPTVVLLKNGEEHGRFVGGRSTKQLGDIFDALLDDEDEGDTEVIGLTL